MLTIDEYLLDLILISIRMFVLDKQAFLKTENNEIRFPDENNGVDVFVFLF